MFLLFLSPFSALSRPFKPPVCHSRPAIWRLAPGSERFPSQHLLYLKIICFVNSYRYSWSIAGIPLRQKLKSFDKMPQINSPKQKLSTCTLGTYSQNTTTSINNVRTIANQYKSNTTNVYLLQPFFLKTTSSSIGNSTRIESNTIELQPLFGKSLKSSSGKAWENLSLLWMVSGVKKRTFTTSQKMSKIR